MLDLLLSFLILAGAAFTFIARSVWPDWGFLHPLHGPTKATTLGWAACSSRPPSTSARAARASACTRCCDAVSVHHRPVSAHLLSKAALHLELRSWRPRRARGRSRASATTGLRQ